MKIIYLLGLSLTSVGAFGAENYILLQGGSMITIKPNVETIVECEEQASQARPCLVITKRRDPYIVSGEAYEIVFFDDKSSVDNREYYRESQALSALAVHRRSRICR